jgi:hypothetical protein
MKRLIRKAEEVQFVKNSEGQEVNPNLYAEAAGVIYTELKEEVLEFIMDELDWDGDSEYEQGYKSNNYYEPDESENANISATGKLPISKLQEKFGTISPDDLEILKEELGNGSLEDYLKDRLDDFKEGPVNSVELENTNITVNSTEIKIEISGYGDEFDHEDYGDY